MAVPCESWPLGDPPWRRCATPWHPVAALDAQPTAATVAHTGADFGRRAAAIHVKKGCSMPIHATCPSCGTAVMVPDDEAGQTQNCETCGETFRAPREAPDALLATLEAAGPAADGPRPATCPRCGDPVPPGGPLCPRCGFDFRRTELLSALRVTRRAAPPAGEPVPRECPTYAWIQWLVGVFTAVGIIIICLSTIGFLYDVAQWLGRSGYEYVEVRRFTSLALVLGWVYGVVYGLLVIGLAQAFAAFRHIALNVWTLTHRAVAQPPAAPD